MRRKSMLCALSALVAGLIFCTTPASASLSVFKTYNGNVAATQDGCGSTSQACSISLSVPLGSTVVAAYLYTGMFNADPSTPPGGTLNGNTITYGPNVSNATACCSLASARADVTSIVAPLINGAVTTSFTFNVTETFFGQDGEGLVIVYSNPAIAASTVGILDGFASVTGDTTSINFADPLDPTAVGFQATMALGDNFSCCSQESTVTVNGKTLTTVAGNNDDSKDASLSNGNLITVGGPNDGFTAATPATPATNYATDHEYYNLIPFITTGDTSITVNTVNATQDDNIFLAVFDVSGLAAVNAPPPTDTTPEPSSLGMLGLGIVGLLAMRKYQGAKLAA